ncbi:hypothetical protein V8F20_000128 [Naviculisporaceae sp. PSN 640]
MLDPLDASVQQQSHAYYPLVSPTIDLDSGRTPFYVQEAAPNFLTSGAVSYQTIGVPRPPAAVSPLSPISPDWATHQQRSPSWSLPDAEFTLHCPPPPPNCAPPIPGLAAPKDPFPGRAASLTHSAGFYASYNATGYLSPPAQYFPTTYNNHDRHCEPTKASENNNLGSASDNSHTGLVSPPRSLIGQPPSTTISRQQGPGHLLVPSRDSQGLGITIATPSLYSQSPSPTSSTNSPGRVQAGSGLSSGSGSGSGNSLRNSTPTSPRSGTTSQRRSYIPCPSSQPGRNDNNSSAAVDLSTAQTVEGNDKSPKKDKKEKIRAYHREVGARNRQKEKEERQRFEEQAQWLERVNLELVAEEKSLATEKLVLVNELFRHYSVCGAHSDVEEYLAVESLKIVKRAKSRFLKQEHSLTTTDLPPDSPS